MIVKTVGELQNLLETLPDHLPIIIEGHDGYGNSEWRHNVEVDETGADGYLRLKPLHPWDAKRRGE